MWKNFFEKNFKKIWKKRKTIISLYPILNHLTFNSETT